MAIQEHGTGSQRENTVNLSIVLRRHLGQRTVLGVAIPMLDDYLLASRAGRVPNGLTEKRIEEGFRQLASEFLHSDFHSTYIARRLGKAGFLDLTEGRYRLRPSLLANTTVGELDQLK